MALWWNGKFNERKLYIFSVEAKHVMRLSIIIPVYNEKNTILEILRKVEDVKLKDIEKEILIIDDFSTDGTRNILRKLKNYKVFYHEINQGKGWR